MADLSRYNSKKPINELARSFIAAVEAKGFKVSVTPTGKGKTFQALWVTRDGDYVATMSPAGWGNKSDPCVCVFRFDTKAKAPPGFNKEQFAAAYEVPVSQLRVHTEKDGGTYLSIRDTDTALKLLLNRARWPVA